MQNEFSSQNRKAEGTQKEGRNSAHQAFTKLRQGTFRQGEGLLSTSEQRAREIPICPERSHWCPAGSLQSYLTAGVPLPHLSPVKSRAKTAELSGAVPSWVCPSTGSITQRGSFKLVRV